MPSRRALLGLAFATTAAAAIGGAAARRRISDQVRAADAAFPPIGRKVTVDSGAGPVAIHLTDSGPRSAEAVVLLHGASGNLRDFGFGLSDRLAARRRVIAVDRPGHGHSQRGPGGDGDAIEAHRPDVQARLMRAAVAQVGVERVILVGHSLGAASALAWALDAPESVAAVVSLAGVSHPWPGSAGALYDAAVAPFLGGLIAGAATLLTSSGATEQAVKSIFSPQAPPEGYTSSVGAALATRPASFRANAEDIARLKPILKAQSARYPALAMPIEVVHGDRDLIVSARVHAAPLAERAPGARLTTLPGVGHMPHHADPAGLESAVERAATRA